MTQSPSRLHSTAAQTHNEKPHLNPPPEERLVAPTVREESREWMGLSGSDPLLGGWLPAAGAAASVELLLAGCCCKAP